jgi:dihydroorotase
LKAHSEKVEENSIKRMLSVVTQTKTNLHFCHVSSENGLKAIIDGKKMGLNITCEVTPHHLFLSFKDFQRKGPLALTIPPVREAHHKIFLWKMIKIGWVDILASDHAPHTLMEKNADLIWDVNPGISGLETTLPLLLTEVNNGKLTVAELVRLTSENPAKIFNLKDRASLTEGKQADLVVIDLKKQFKIDSTSFFSKAAFSPFDGRKVQGKPVKTFVSGQLVFDEGEIIGKMGSGKILRRN